MEKLTGLNKTDVTEISKQIADALRQKLRPL